MKKILSVLFLCTAYAASVNASLIGDDIALTVTDEDPIGNISTIFGPATATGDASAVEWGNVDGFSGAPNDVDILDEDTIEISLSLVSVAGSRISGRDFTFTDVDWAGAGTVLDLVNFTTFGQVSYDGFTLLSPTSFRIDNVALGVGTFTPTDLATLTFDVVASYSTVAEPSVTALLFLGLAAAGFATRRMTP